MIAVACVESSAAPLASAWPALAALGAGLTWALGSLLFGRALSLGSDSGTLAPAAVNAFKNALATAVFLSCFAACDAQWPDARAWPALLLSGACGFAVGDTLYFAALPRAGVQASAMAGLVHVPGTVLLAWIFLGEQLALATLAFMLVVVTGVLLVARSSRADGSPTPRARRIGVAFALAAALSQSVGVVVGHEGMEDLDLLGGTLVRMFGGLGGAIVGAIATGCLAGRGGRDVVDLLRPLARSRSWRALWLAALCGSVLGLPLFHLALRDLPGGVASVLFATTPLFTLVLGPLFGARHGLGAWLGTLVGFAGVAGLVWSLGGYT